MNEFVAKNKKIGDYSPQLQSGPHMHDPASPEQMQAPA